MESYFRKFSVCGPASHIIGKEPIDGIWSSSRVVPSAVTVFSHSFGVGDHQGILLDFRKEDLQGQHVSICRPSMRRLICDYPSIVDKYNKEAFHLLQYHKVPQQLDRLESHWQQLDSTGRAKRLYCIY